MVAPEIPAPERWLVDGFNVLHVGILRGRERGRWWGGEARSQLLSRVQGFAEAGELVVVFDGSDPEGDEKPPESSAQVVFAPSADDWILSQVKTGADPERVHVVTADRRLADRARHRGAQILSPRAFLALCPEPDTAAGALLADSSENSPGEPQS